MIALEPLGDRAFLARFATETEARGWAASVRRLAPIGVVDVVLAYRGVAVHADPDRVELKALGTQLAAIPLGAIEATAGRLVTVPVLYDGEDLGHVAAHLNLTIEDVVALHTGCDYRVLALGFLPGFAYAGDLDPRLSGLPRRASPRTRVSAGSVAIVENQTGIYPADSPGGWHLIGRTPLRIVDLAHGHFPIAAGDSLRFVAIDEPEYRGRFGEMLGLGATGPLG